MTSFLTPTELKAYPLPVTAAQWAKVTDNKIQEVLDSASAHIEDYLDRSIPSAYYTERIVGNGRYTLMLENYPIIGVLYVSAHDLNENEVIYDYSSFLVHSGAGIIEWVSKTSRSFSKDRVWEVHYYAGYPVVPGPIKHATALQAVEMLQPLFRGGTDFVTVELIDGLQESIVDLLEKYKRKRMG